MTLGHLITESREAQNLSQRALAGKIGRSGSYVALLEGGRRVPSVTTLDRLANALGWDATRRAHALALAAG